jgi:alpha-mannosidase
MFEICAHKWVSVEEAGSGLALLNDCKYGHDVSGGNIRLTLLRSPAAPDEEADQGRHSFTYSLFPFEGPFAQSGAVRAAYELNAPAVWECGSGTEAGEPDAAAETGLSAYSLLSIDNPAVILECLKAPEPPFGLTEQKKSRALVFRLYESVGSSGWATVSLSSLGGPGSPDKQIAGVWETDMLERPKKNLNNSRNEITLEFRPFEIKTILVEFWD